MAEPRQVVAGYTYWLNAAGVWVPVSTTAPLPVTGGAAWESGIATGGSNTTLVDTTRDWETNILENDYLEITISSVIYTRRILSNTATTLTFSALPVGVVVAADDTYEIKLAEVEAKKTVLTILDEPLIAAAPAATGLDDCDALNLVDQTPYLALTVKARYDVAATQGIRVHVLTSPTNDATGTHTAVAHATIMTDDVAHFVANELIGLTIENVTDGSSGLITANNETSVTVAGLAGGVTDQWNNLDVYSIDGADYDTEDWDTWTPAFGANEVLRQTKVYQSDPMYLKVLIENLDPAQTVTDVEVIATEGA